RSEIRGPSRFAFRNRTRGFSRFQATVLGCVRLSHAAMYSATPRILRVPGAPWGPARCPRGYRDQGGAPIWRPGPSRAFRFGAVSAVSLDATLSVGLIIPKATHESIFSYKYLKSLRN